MLFFKNLIHLVLQLKIPNQFYKYKRIHCTYNIALLDQSCPLMLQFHFNKLVFKFCKDRPVFSISKQSERFILNIVA